MTEKKGLLPQIQSLRDLKALPVQDLPQLAEEIRRRIIDVVSENGGHLASSLGIVELTIALHRVFHSPVDKIIWDVGHQCYAHKILTGRNEGMDSLRKLGGLSGFPKRKESEHDIVETGHASTSLSTALGISVAQAIQGVKGKVVAVIGDGSLNGGMALEALNQADRSRNNIIFILNDNRMSIGKNMGAISYSRSIGAVSSQLSRFTSTTFYQKTRDKIDKGLSLVPFFNGLLLELAIRFKKAVKAVFYKDNLFSDLGYAYIGPVDGHSFRKLIPALQSACRVDKPVIVHVLTRKGKGYPHSEIDPTLYHGVRPFSILDGKMPAQQGRSFTEVFSSFLLSMAEENRDLVAITAAMAAGTGLSPFQDRFPGRFFDVGIAEQHAVGFAAGLAAGGLRPVAAIYSTFMQRAVDQVIHDVALPNLPVVFMVDRAGIVGEDGETHQGAFDIPLFRSVPNLALLAPADGEELKMMFRWSLTRQHPVMIRYPKDNAERVFTLEPQPLQEGRGAFLKQDGGDVLLVSAGALAARCAAAAAALAEDAVTADILSLRFIKPLDLTWFTDVAGTYEYVVIVEDGAALGGIGEYILSSAAFPGKKPVMIGLGIADHFIPHGSRDECLSLNGLDAESIRKKVLSLMTGKLRVVRPHTAG
ncbi:MAG: 1-deoxy-D-xylulose-5-phosphate synthase [Spirochaetales bacterium]|nr:1-deoxy-D-xylulose-5-phosphate synthase [Spirochaetales bacterium]